MWSIQAKTGSITIHKYDMTAAKQAGVNTSQFTPTGKQDAAAEAALEKICDQRCGI